MKLLKNTQARVSTVTCVSAIIQGEGPVGVLTIAQRGHRNKTGVVFSLCGYHIHWRLRSTAAVREIF